MQLEPPRRAIAVALALAAVLAAPSLAPLARGDDDKEDLKGALEQTPEGAVLAVQGTVVLPDDAVIAGALHYENVVVVPNYRAIVKGKKVELRFGPYEKTLLAGNYQVKLELPRQLQPEALQADADKLVLQTKSVSIAVGTKDEGKSARELVRRKMLDVAEAFRLSYLELGLVGYFYRGNVDYLEQVEKKANPPLPPPVIEKIRAERAEYLKAVLPVWKSATNGSWTERFKTMRYDWRSYRSQLFATPFPESEAILDQYERAVEAWNRAMQRAIYALARKNDELPREFREGTAFEPEQHEKAISDAAAALHESLGSKLPNHELSDLRFYESGGQVDVQGDRAVPAGNGDWYRSFVTGFGFRRPRDWGWLPSTSPRPSVRARTAPRPDDKSVSVVVEVFDFPFAHDEKNLLGLVRQMNRERWLAWAAREVSSKEQKVLDPTMPGDARTALDTEVSIQQGGVKLHARLYQLLGRGNDRTYGVFCMCPEDKWEANKAAFDLCCKNLRVLDSPLYRQKQYQQRPDVKDPGPGVDRRAFRWQFGLEVGKG